VVQVDSSRQTPTVTLGIDLSAQPRETACCIVEWGPSSARIAHLDAGFDNAALLALIERWQPTKVAIDSPFGWPLEFTRTIAAFTEFGSWPDTDDRRPLLFRTTDLVVKDLTGTDPLSVSSNLLAICAMRCAGFLTRLTQDSPLDRTGSGLVVEVYPAAALRQWGLDPRGYKGTKPEKHEKRKALVALFADATANWLRLDAPTIERLGSSDHLLDALISAVIGRAAEAGLTLPIRPDQAEPALAEGWIHLPHRAPLSEFDPFSARDPA
jgi:hypothetical protein